MLADSSSQDVFDGDEGFHAEVVVTGVEAVVSVAFIVHSGNK